MPPPPRARTALQAMKSIGFSSKEAAPILRKLLEVYENNWEYIEDNDYQVLIDSILEAQEAKASTTKQNAVAGDDPEHSRKRIRKLSENPSTSTLATDCSGETLLKKPKLEADVSPEEQLGGIIADPVQLQVDDTGRIDVASSQFGNRQKMTEPTSAEPSFSSKKAEQNLSLVNRRETRASSRAQKTSSPEENAEHLMPGRDKMSASGRSRNSIYLKEPKTEPDDEYQQNQVQANVAEALAAQRTQATDKGKRKDSSSSGVRLENGNTSHDASPSTIDIASSYTGAVKLQFSFKTGHPDFSAPSVDTVLKMVEEKCLQCHKISEPDFSLLKLMKEVCQFASELTNPSNEWKYGFDILDDCMLDEKEDDQLFSGISFFQRKFTREQLSRSIHAGAKHGELPYNCTSYLCRRANYPPVRNVIIFLSDTPSFVVKLYKEVIHNSN